MAFNYVLFSKSLASTKDKVVGLYKTRIDAIIKINTEIRSLYKDKGTKTADSCLTGDDYYFDGKSRYYLVYQNNYDDLVTEPITWDELVIENENGQEYLDKLKNTIAQEVKEKNETEQKNDDAVRSLLLTHKLPMSFSSNPFCWCVIDLEKYKEVLQSDSDEIEDAGEYADQAWTILRGNQLYAYGCVDKMQGKLAILVGQTRYVEDKFGSIGKPKQKYVYPFNDNYIYALTVEGIGKLLDDCDNKFGDNTNDLANWCFDAEETGKLPEQNTNQIATVYVRDAMFPMQITQEDHKNIPLLDAISKLTSVKQQNMFLDYFK